MHSERKKRSRLWLLILAAVFAGSALIGAAFAKYLKTSTFTGQLQFNAKLADSIVLRESTAERQADGSYELTEPYVKKNTYDLIPGLNIPKDPHVVITNKTSIEAYLYVEVVDKTLNEAIVWTMAEHWKPLDDVEGKREKGTVYVYTDGDGNPVPLTRTEEDIIIYLLKDNEIEVKQGLLGEPGNNTLKFYAAMGEVNAVTDGAPIEKAKAVYKNHIAAVTP